MLYNQIIILGIVVSILFTELTGLSPAGLIVPAYIVLCLNTPERLIYTLLVSLLALGLGKILNNFIILYGRRRFAVMIILCFFVDFLIGHVFALISTPSMVGIIIPGIIASEFEKQGIFRSLISLGIVVGIISLIMLSCDISVFRI